MRARLFTEPFIVGTRRDHRNEPSRDRRGHPDGLYRDHIEDAERFCVRIIDKGLENIGMYVTDTEHEDLLAEMLQVLLKAERNFDPAKNSSFAGYASWLLTRRFIDLAPRALLGRTGGRIAERSHEELDDTAAGGTRHLETLTPQPGDADPHQRPGRGRLERDRARLTTWAHTELGLRAA